MRWFPFGKSTQKSPVSKASNVPTNENNEDVCTRCWIKCPTDTGTWNEATRCTCRDLVRCILLYLLLRKGKKRKQKADQFEGTRWSCKEWWRWKTTSWRGKR